MVLPVASQAGRCTTSSQARCNCFHTRMHTHTYAKQSALIAVLSVCPAGKSFSCLVSSRLVSHAHHVTEGDRKVTVAGTLEMVNLELKPSQPAHGSADMQA